MYKEIENPVRMTRDEVCEKYQGKWIYLIHLDGSEFSMFETAIPVIVAERAWAGKEEGIYDKYLDDDTIQRQVHLSLLPNEANIFGFNEMSSNLSHL